jgi:hypothetical protein
MNQFPVSWSIWGDTPAIPCCPYNDSNHSDKLSGVFPFPSSSSTYNSYADLPLPPEAGNEVIQFIRSAVSLMITSLPTLIPAQSISNALMIL